jgi:hypothetical protein
VTEPPTFRWGIEDIFAAHPGLYLEHCAAMAVALLSRHSPSPGEFVVHCEGFEVPGLASVSSFQLSVAWEERTAAAAARVLRTEQTRPIVERAAVALAALLFGRLIPDGRMQVTRQGDRADYWLPQLRRAVEISGTDRPREVSRRCRAKRAQMLGNPRGWDGYVVVCCFSPGKRVIHWSHHTQEEARL